MAVLGGTQTYTYFLENDLLDEIYLTIEPVVFGRGLNLFESSKGINASFHLESTKQLNDNGSLLLHYAKP
ncbi:MAG: dihydrofolate reductase family protein [bacterium]|nr:dihydrofolate reductase family protein [bacterium]